MSYKQFFLDYLKFYAEKNIDAIVAMITDDIALRDWNISVKGRTSFIEETSKNFNNVDNLTIEVLHTYESNNAVAGELRITINNSQEIFVVDIITFTPEGKISSIKAYIGRND